MKKISKILSIVITIAMLMGMVPAFAADATVTISSNAGNAPTPIGSTVTISAVVGNESAAEKLEFYENSNLVATFEDLESAISYDATVNAGTKTVFAQLLDDEGYVVAKSNEILVKGYTETVNDQMWDIDFEDEQFQPILENYPEYRYLADASGNRLSITRAGAKSTLTAHTGTTANTMWVEETGDAYHGKAIKMTTAVVNQNQFNEFRAINAGDTIKSEWDVKFTKIPPRQDHLRANIHEVNIASSGAGDNVVTIQTLGVKYVGETPYIYCVNDETIVEELIKDKWYNVKSYVDTVNEVIYCYLNNKLVMSMSIADTVANWQYLYTWKYKVDLYYAIGTEIWVDNFNVARVEYADSTPTIELSSDANNATIPEGSYAKIAIGATNAASVAQYKILSSVDGVNFTEFKTIPATDASFNVQAKAWPVGYMVKALDSTGAVLSSSNSVEIAGKKENPSYYAWNMNFDEEGMTILDSGLYKYPSLDGTTPYKPVGDTYTCHIGGDTGNTVTIESSSAIAGANNGNSLVLTTNDKDYNCQVNAGYAQVKADIAVYSVDVATTTNTYKSLLEFVLSTNDLPGIYAQSNGTITLGADDVIGTYEVNKWMNIKYMFNIATGVADIFIDNVHVKSFETAYAGQTAYRMCIRNGVAANTKTYIDNVKAYQMTYTQSAAELGFANVNYSINGAVAEDAAPGALSVNAVVSNDGQARDVIMFVAVYRDKTLQRCYPVVFSFGEGDTHDSVSIDAGTLLSGDSVKTLLWYDDIATPVCQAVELN